jgi:hypothetical protein
MSERIDIEELIFLNQVAQGVRSVNDINFWFEKLTPARRSLILKMVGQMIQNARPELEDGLEAVKQSGLKPTFTPCVLLTKGANREQIKKILTLSAPEQNKSLILLLSLFRIADQRRRIREPDASERHWWHRDLGNSGVLDEIRRLDRAGEI